MKHILMMTMILMMSVTARADYVNSTDGLRLRKACGTQSEVLSVMPYGAEVDEIARAKIGRGTWVKVKYDGNIGYCAADYLSSADPLDGMTYLGTWRVTAYAYTGSPCANGEYPEAGRTIAHNSLPFGTRVYIDGVGIRTVEDRGPAWLGDAWCDLYLGDTQECVAWGDQYREVWRID